MRLNVAVEDAEDVGRRAADVDADHVDALRARRSSAGCCPTAPGVGMIGASVQRDELVVARRMRHHVLEEQVVNRVAGRAEVLALQHRPQVVDDRQVDRVVERLLRRAAAASLLPA